MVRHAIPELHVLSYDEVPDDKQLKVIASIGAPQSSLNG
jgi:flagellar biosynthesis protein FlhA